MRRILVFSLLMVFLVVASGAQSNGQATRKKAKVPVMEMEEEGPDCPETIADCPIQGCGKGADLKLNTAKNTIDVPSEANIQDMTLNKIRALKQPGVWPTNKDRSSLQGAGKEGTPVRVKGFLQRAKKEGAESCNCGVLGVANTDIHLVLVNNPDDPESSSVTVEMTPRVRQQNNHANWTFGKVNDFDGDYVRVTGWLTLDTKHIAKPLVRATNWEVHPVIKFEHCTKAKSTCDKPNSKGWEEF